MGYTHYWNMQRVTAEDTAGYLRALPLVKELIERHQDILEAVEDNGNTLPIASEKEILFNGIGEDAHETFVFRCPEIAEGNGGDPALRDFCKTARKPYDLPVCLVLLTLAAHMPNLELASDGLRQSFHVQPRGGLLVTAPYLGCGNCDATRCPGVRVTVARAWGAYPQISTASLLGICTL